MEDWGAVVDVGGVIVSGEEILVVRGGKVKVEVEYY